MATQLTMELETMEDVGSTEADVSGRADHLAGGVSAIAMAVPSDGVAAFRFIGRELVTRQECRRRLKMTSVTVTWLINDLKVLDLEKDDAGREMVVWVFGTDRQSLLDRYVADRGIPRDPAAFEAYRAALRGLDREVVHRDEVILAARRSCSPKASRRTRTRSQA